MNTERTVLIADRPYEVGIWYKRQNDAARRFLLRYDEIKKRVHYQTSDPKEDRSCSAAAWAKWVGA